MGKIGADRLAPEVHVIAVQVEQGALQPRIGELLVELNRHLRELERSGDVAEDAHQHQAIDAVGEAGLLGVAVAERVAHPLQRQQREDPGPADVRTRHHVDEDAHDGPLLRVGHQGRVEQAGDALARHALADLLRFAIGGLLDAGVGVRECDPEQLQRARTDGHPLVVGASDLIELHLEDEDADAVELRSGVVEEQTDGLLGLLEAAAQVLALGPLAVEREAERVTRAPRGGGEERRAGLEVGRGGLVGRRRLRPLPRGEVEAGQLEPLRRIADPRRPGVEVVDAVEARLVAPALGLAGEEQAPDAQVRLGLADVLDQRIRRLLHPIVQEAIRDVRVSIRPCEAAPAPGARWRKR